MKTLIARMAATLSAVALLGTSFSLAGNAQAIAPGCMLEYPTVRTTTTVTTPGGASPGKADLITVKVINSSTSTDCYDGTVTITPRTGMGFTSIVNLPAGWLCIVPSVGLPGNVVCSIPTVSKASSTTIRVRYDKMPDVAVSGTASSTLTFGKLCENGNSESSSSVCSV